MVVQLLGRKIGMTQIYGEDGNIIPVTVIEAGPCTVLQLKTKDRDGYEAVQIGFDDKLSQKDVKRPEGQRVRSHSIRAERGHVVQLDSKRQKKLRESGVAPVPKAGGEAKRYIKEFRTDGHEHGCKVGDQLTVAAFKELKAVDVVGVSKGRGTSGVMRRHNFKGQRATHGVKKVHRHAGGIGAHTDPSRVWKGKRMAGQMGNVQVTSRNLKLVRVDEATNSLLVRGAVPGPVGAYVVIRDAK